MSAYSTLEQCVNAKSLYVHFPFCETKCHYCDFYSLREERVASVDRQLLYSAIEDELASRLPHFIEFKTIFFGGGTPSLVPLETLARVIERLQSVKNFNRSEFTMEANPSSFKLERFKKLISLGVNRLSLGVQSIRDDHLKWMGRAHDSTGAFSAIENAFKAGFKNVSVDRVLQEEEQFLQTYLKPSILTYL